jgi:putative spermidine/putrescine transport system permease protein
MWEDLRYALDPTIAAVSTLTILLTVAPLLWAHVLSRRGRAG